jgi:hypothetical protein
MASTERSVRNKRAGTEMVTSLNEGDETQCIRHYRVTQAQVSVCGDAEQKASMEAQLAEVLQWMLLQGQCDCNNALREIALLQLDTAPKAASQTVALPIADTMKPLEHHDLACARIRPQVVLKLPAPCSSTQSMPDPLQPHVHPEFGYDSESSATTIQFNCTTGNSSASRLREDGNACEVCTTSSSSSESDLADTTPAKLDRPLSTAEAKFSRKLPGVGTPPTQMAETEAVVLECKVWELIPRSYSRQPPNSRWIFRRKVEVDEVRPMTMVADRCIVRGFGTVDGWTHDFIAR